MNDCGKTYTVGEVAKLAGVTVRTLRYYDRIGLLRPAGRTEAGYRLYRTDDLHRLQQIMFYRELNIPLEEIGEVLDNEEFDQISALVSHRERLLAQKQRTETLIATIDKTLMSLKGETMLTDEELYDGFSKEEVEKLKEYEKEAERKYDPALVAESQRRVRSMSKDQWKRVQEEGDEITRLLASLMGTDPSSLPVQEAIGRHYRYLHNFYTPNPVMYRGLGDTYVTDSRFRAYYDKFAPGLADFMKQAIDAFCDRQ
jgi:DNA-binding transcriptional MerR regulator